MSQFDRSTTLFTEVDLTGTLDGQRRTMVNEIEALDPNRVLNTSPDDLVTYFVDKNFVDTPRLRRDEWSVEAKEGVESRADYGWRTNVKVQHLHVTIPFDGEEPLFKARASTFSTAPPRGVVGQQTLTLIVTASSDDDAKAVRAKIEREVDSIERHLHWVRNDVDRHNEKLKGLAERALEKRRELLLKHQGLVASLGIPLRERSDSPKTYVAPNVRRNVAPSLPPASTAPFKPEPALEMQVYEHILEIVQSMTKVMERSPTTFANAKEESLRDHYLVALNSHYRGSATGETFNASGKTDILVREQDKNIFIGECKFWKGAKGYTDTIDQLLGYSSWRDTKTAIIVFNRNQDTSKVLNEIQVTTEAHVHYKRTLPWPSDSGSRFVMHHPSDRNRELIMTVLVFDIPEKAAPKSSTKANKAK